MNTFEFSRNFDARNHAPLSTWRGLLAFEKTLFVLINLMDVVMTFLLLNSGSFYESNPLADFILQRWGMLGMTLFKLAVVGIVLLIANLVALWQIETSRNLLHFGSFLVGTVVAYSVYLMLMFA